MYFHHDSNSQVPHERTMLTKAELWGLLDLPMHGVVVAFLVLFASFQFLCSLSSLFPFDSLPQIESIERNNPVFHSPHSLMLQLILQGYCYVKSAIVAVTWTEMSQYFFFFPLLNGGSKHRWFYFLSS